MQHQRLIVTGRVQGVGFRPFVYHLATELGLKGQVQNNGQGVIIDLVGNIEVLESFRSRLLTDKPSAAEIDAVQEAYSQTSPANSPATYDGFQILNSDTGGLACGADSAQIPADLPVCQECLQDLFNPSDRRYRYPFINCTQCGPRYTLIQLLPYDRCRTSMAKFAMCSDCDNEFHSIASRRFHAQPNACADCGPQLWMTDCHGQSVVTDDVVTRAVSLINEGSILAIKGLGGFHLVCDARNPKAVARLRERKSRPHKPLAVMGLNPSSLESVVKVDEILGDCLQSQERPVVLAPKGSTCDRQLEQIAPEMADLGVMLPYTPLHYLLFHEAAERPKGDDWLSQPHPLLLVMTSANRSGEPLVYENDQCLNRLSHIADYFILHDRDIVTRCDDSVVLSANPPMMVRRARGWTPRPVTLPAKGPSVLACGGYLKNSICLTHGRFAYLSPHIGDLDHPETCQWLGRVVSHMTKLVQATPEVVVCDDHPDFYSTRFAEAYALEHNLPLIKVQHHRAHLAAVMAESSVSGPVLGLALDGVGLGDDQSPWGGEMFYGDAGSFDRIAHLSTLPLVGGDKATREIWRLGAGLLSHMGLSEHARQRFGHLPMYSAFSRLADNAIPSLTAGSRIMTCSAGRWFDAAAAILGIYDEITFEAQAPMALEAKAASVCMPTANGLARVTPTGLLDLEPIIKAMLDIEDKAQAAAIFHTELVDGLVRWVEFFARKYGVVDVVASGGCLLNRILREGLQKGLAKRGLRLHLSGQVPCNDGGLCLGQAWIAMSQMTRSPGMSLESMSSEVQIENKTVAFEGVQE
ncbi:carbamoyltransferase HypF [Hahella sp. CCB-MM4]|uniref:carbamoyltransferase HypF n=1 Tax=Hahella sp. (strain CCB-MM4) TaxID=1926491 RepID=UPI000B9AECDC|nr:carbamoyltransferase HypF [Hahella sp. CCB-MM4]OZG72921.1 carbamoyltransferase HypF [Hahella sp. CCB-MM4]